MAKRSDEQRSKDEQLIERALLGQLLRAHDKRIHAKVVGVKFENPDGSSRQELIEQLAQFEEAILVPNPHDSYDENAIMVVATINGRRQQIGNIDRTLAAEISPAIRRGEEWKAITTRVAGPYTKGVSLLLYRVAKPKPSRGEIERRAFEIYQSRGAGHGLHDEDWQQAEAELQRQL